ncbi:hypothetical protein [Neorhizobium sp. T25_13]|jgi:hypothetical protein|uniref:hypothetical protein n=1 Tax=Neorhizobium sp. T25_13 TaxID=2093830 RepID=UPI001FE0ADFC|nr:hypothetical protein [Neorhizobium sp. T25_13]
MIDIERFNDVRRKRGFMTVEDTSALSSAGVVVLDPFSTLVSQDVMLGPGVTLWPGVILHTGDCGAIAIRSDAQLYPGSRLVAAKGRITVGARAEIGEEGGFTIKAEQPDAVIEVGEGARLIGGGSLKLSNSIGAGAQILGPIQLQNCVLEGGGTHLEPDPDRRGAVLKGYGVARHIVVPAGSVIQAFGLFSEAPVRKQSYFHPKPGN